MTEIGPCEGCEAVRRLHDADIHGFRVSLCRRCRNGGFSALVTECWRSYYESPRAPQRAYCTDDQGSTEARGPAA